MTITEASRLTDLITAASVDTQPPVKPEVTATSNPPNQIDQLPAGAEPDQAGACDATQPRGRGRPRKNLQIVKKPIVNNSPPTSPVPVPCEPPKRPRGRPKGSQNRATPGDPISYSLFPDNNPFLFISFVHSIRDGTQSAQQTATARVGRPNFR